MSEAGGQKKRVRRAELIENAVWPLEDEVPAASVFINNAGDMCATLCPDIFFSYPRHGGSSPPVFTHFQSRRSFYQWLNLDLPLPSSMARVISIYQPTLCSLNSSVPKAKTGASESGVLQTNRTQSLKTFSMLMCFSLYSAGASHTLPAIDLSKLEKKKRKKKQTCTWCNSSANYILKT